VLIVHGLGVLLVLMMVLIHWHGSLVVFRMRLFVRRAHFLAVLVLLPVDRLARVPPCILVHPDGDVRLIVFAAFGFPPSCCG